MYQNIFFLIHKLKFGACDKIHKICYLRVFCCWKLTYLKTSVILQLWSNKTTNILNHSFSHSLQSLTFFTLGGGGTLPWFLCLFKEVDIFAGSFRLRQKPTDLTNLSRWARPCPNDIVLQLKHWPNEFVPVTGAVIRQRTILLGHCLKVVQSC